MLVFVGLVVGFPNSTQTHLAASLQPLRASRTVSNSLSSVSDFKKHVLGLDRFSGTPKARVVFFWGQFNSGSEV